jgi:hypothetical protein
MTNYDKKFSFIAASNSIHEEKNYVNEFYLPLKYTFEKLKLPISSGKDAGGKLFIITKVVVGGINHVIYVFQNSFAFHFVSTIFTDTYFLNQNMMDLLDKLASEKTFLLTKKDYPKLKSKYNNKRIFLYSHIQCYAAITIQRTWFKYTGNPKYKYCRIYNLNKMVYDTNISKFEDFHDQHYKYLFDRTMISLKNKFLNDIIVRDKHYKYLFDRTVISLKNKFLKSKI